MSAHDGNLDPYQCGSCGYMRSSVDGEECAECKLAKAVETPTSSPQPGDIVWGCSQEPETWHTGGATREEAIREGRALYGDDAFYIQWGTYADPVECFPDARDVIERAEEYAADNWGTEDDVFTEIDRDALDAALAAVYRAHVKCSRWQVTNTTPSELIAALTPTEDT